MLGNVGWEVKRYKRERERDLVFGFMKNKFSLLRWISRTDYRKPRLSQGSRLPRVFAAASIYRVNNGSRVSWRASTRVRSSHLCRNVGECKNNDSSFLINGLLNSVILQILSFSYERCEAKKVPRRLNLISPPKDFSRDKNCGMKED